MTNGDEPREDDSGGHPWIKLEAAIIQHPKVVDAGADAFLVFIVVLCAVKLWSRGGALGPRFAAPAYLARLLPGWDPDRCLAALRCAQSAGLLGEGEDGGITVEAWGRYQRDATAAERQRRKRARDTGTDASPRPTVGESRRVTPGSVTDATSHASQSSHARRSADARTARRRKRDSTRENDQKTTQVRELALTSHACHAGRDGTGRDVTGQGQDLDSSGAGARDDDMPPPLDPAPAAKDALSVFVLATWPVATEQRGWDDWSAAQRVACPDVDLMAAAKKAAGWCASNPKKAPKSDIKRFLGGWFLRDQDKVAPGGVRLPPRNGRPATAPTDDAHSEPSGMMRPGTW